MRKEEDMKFWRDAGNEQERSSRASGPDTLYTPATFVSYSRLKTRVLNEFL
jgi:hypothetical protein